MYTCDNSLLFQAVVYDGDNQEKLNYKLRALYARSLIAGRGPAPTPLPPFP